MAPLGGRHLMWAVAGIAASADQISKAVAVRALSPGRPVTVIPGFFDLTLVMNPGGVFGLLRDLEGPFRGVLFSVVPLVVAGLIVWYGLRLPAGHARTGAALGLILGGAVGNLTDRFRLGHVVDFLDAYVGPYHWPAFNLADSGICVGVGILLLESLFLRDAAQGARTAPPPAP